MARLVLDRRIQFYRATLEDDDVARTEVFAAHGDPLWASKVDVSDGERALGGGVSASLTSRFVIYSTSYSRDLTPKDQIEFDGNRFNVSGIKTRGRNRFLEITAGAKVDG